MTRPRRIGRYTIVGELPPGGTSRVFLAQCDGEPEIRVLKQMRRELSRDATARKRFEREALLATLLDHRNIARILWNGVEEGAFCLAMELVAGQTLFAIMERLRARQERMPPEIAIPIALGVLRGLGHAHALSDTDGHPLEVVHRDLSANNVMVSYQGVSKIIDFGTAQGRLDDFRTSPGVRIGTLLYMSPEQSMSMPVDARSDLYCVGVLLFEMLSGAHPVQSTAPVDVLEEIAYGVPPLASEHADVSEELAEVVARALAKDPEHRWQSATEMAEALAEEAGPLAATKEEEIGRFMRALFPEEEKGAAAAMARGRDRHLSEFEETVPEDEPLEVERTMETATVLPEYSDTVGLDMDLDPAAPVIVSGRAQPPAERVAPAPPPSEKKPSLLVISIVMLLFGFGLGVTATVILISSG